MEIKAGKLRIFNLDISLELIRVSCSHDVNNGISWSTSYPHCV